MKVHVHDEHNSILELPEALRREECEALLERAEALGFEDAPITTPWGFVRAPEVRDNTRVLLDDPALAAALWERVREALPARVGNWRVVGLNERFRFYRYAQGQKFAWHRDGAFRRSPEERSVLTLLFYLNEGFEGGATEFELYEPLRVVPRQGAALAFEHRVLHQGAPVLRGRKDVLRTDVMARFEGPAR